MLIPAAERDRVRPLLTPAQYDAWRLAVDEGRTLGQVDRHLGITREAVRERLHAAERAIAKADQDAAA